MLNGRVPKTFRTFLKFLKLNSGGKEFGQNTGVGEKHWQKVEQFFEGGGNHANI